MSGPSEDCAISEGGRLTQLEDKEVPSWRKERTAVKSSSGEGRPRRGTIWPEKKAFRGSVLRLPGRHLYRSMLLLCVSCSSPTRSPPLRERGAPRACRCYWPSSTKYCRRRAHGTPPDVARDTDTARRHVAQGTPRGRPFTGGHRALWWGAIHKAIWPEGEWLPRL